MAFASAWHALAPATVVALPELAPEHLELSSATVHVVVSVIVLVIVSCTCSLPRILVRAWLPMAFVVLMSAAAVHKKRSAMVVPVVVPMVMVIKFFEKTLQYLCGSGTVALRCLALRSRGEVETTYGPHFRVMYLEYLTGYLAYFVA